MGSSQSKVVFPLLRTGRTCPHCRGRHGASAFVSVSYLRGHRNSHSECRCYHFRKAGLILTFLPAGTVTNLQVDFRGDLKLCYPSVAASINIEVCVLVVCLDYGFDLFSVETDCDPNDDESADWETTLFRSQQWQRQRNDNNMNLGLLDSFDEPPHMCGLKSECPSGPTLTFDGLCASNPTTGGITDLVAADVKMEATSSEAGLGTTFLTVLVVTFVILIANSQKTFSSNSEHTGTHSDWSACNDGSVTYNLYYPERIQEEYLFEVRAKDPNTYAIQQAPTIYPFRVRPQNELPNINITSGPPSETLETNAQLIRAQEPLPANVSLFCSLDDRTGTPCEHQKRTIRIFPPGEHLFTISTNCHEPCADVDGNTIACEVQCNAITAKQAQYRWSILGDEQDPDTFIDDVTQDGNNIDFESAVMKTAAAMNVS